jgi:hypothetical protein
MMNIHYISFIYGILVKIVDDIIFFQCLLIMLTIYVIFFNTKLSTIASFTFTIGGVIALIFIPHSVSAAIWKLIILLSIPKFLQHLKKVKDIYNGSTSLDIRNLYYFVLPVLIFSIVFSIIEDFLVPEETSNRKLIDKALQSIMMISFLLIINFIAKKINLKEDHKQLLITLAYGWLGYSLTSVIILIFLLTNNKYNV